jgi:hypothetical protein
VEGFIVKIINMILFIKQDFIEPGRKTREAAMIKAADRSVMIEKRTEITTRQESIRALQKSLGGLRPMNHSERVMISIQIINYR